MARIDTDDKLTSEVGDLAGAGLPAVTSTKQVVADNELLNTEGTTLSSDF